LPLKPPLLDDPPPNGFRNVLMASLLKLWL
jgi:hypothetical protein